MGETTEKWCPGCEQMKSREDFWKRAASADGLAARCVACTTEYRRVNAEKIRARRREYRQENLTQIVAWNREYRRRTGYMREYGRRPEVKAKRRERDAKRDLVRARESARRYYQTPAGRASNLRNNQIRRARKRGLPCEPVSKLATAVRDGAHCWMCRTELSEYEKVHLDHLIPLAADVAALDQLGVSNPGTVQSNMALTCATCGVRKKNRVMLCAVARFLRNDQAASVMVEAA